MTDSQQAPTVIDDRTADQIIRWSEVRPGDLVLMDDRLITAERVNVAEKPWGEGTTFTAVDVSYRDDGRLYTSEQHGGRFTAVRRPARPDRFSTDPDALAWARGHVEKLRDKFRKFGSRCRDDGELNRAMQWRKFANLLDMELIGGTGCVIAPFDERRPEFAALTGEEKPGG